MDSYINIESGDMTSEYNPSSVIPPSQNEYTYFNHTTLIDNLSNIFQPLEYEGTSRPKKAKEHPRKKFGSECSKCGDQGHGHKNCPKFIRVASTVARVKLVKKKPCT